MFDGFLNIDKHFFYLDVRCLLDVCFYDNVQIFPSSISMLFFFIYIATGRYAYTYIYIEEHDSVLYLECRDDRIFLLYSLGKSKKYLSWDFFFCTLQSTLWTIVVLEFQRDICELHSLQGALNHSFAEVYVDLGFVQKVISLISNEIILQNANIAHKNLI